MTENPTVSVIIVSYNTREMTLRCLAALFADLGPFSLEVFLVDNASRDGTTNAVAAAFPTVRVLVNERNLGFAAANNRALALARGRYLLLLNTDAFLHPGCLAAMTSYLDGHPRVGVVGPRLVYEDGSPQRSCWRFPSPWRSWAEAFWISGVLADHPQVGDYRRWPHDEEKAVDFVIGACLLVRRAAYEQAGGFDERFFMYQEEADWEMRLTAAGWQVVFTPAGVATHVAGGSGQREAARVNEHFFQSFDRFSLKHYGTAGFVAMRAAQVVGGLLRVPAWAAASALPSRRRFALGKLRAQVKSIRRQLFTGPPRSAT